MDLFLEKTGKRRTFT